MIRRPRLTLFLIAIVLLSGLATAAFLRAQPPPPLGEEDPPAETVPPAPGEDPGYDGDPTPKEDHSVLGDPLLPGDQDPQFLQEELPPGDELAVTPAAPEKCQGYGGSVTPLAVAAGYDQHYFMYQNQPILLVGVSADNGCHLELEVADKCEVGFHVPVTNPPTIPPTVPTYVAILDDIAAKGLNKIRLWISFGYPANPEWANDKVGKALNEPFQQVNGGLPGSTFTYHYRLDVRSGDYFARLREVVRYAVAKKIFVEVTFFSPGQGDKNEPSPWLKGSKLAAVTNALTPVGFSNPHYFVLPDVAGSDNEKMRTYQQNIINWTVDELWCYDRVYWEIANEPEAPDLKPTDVATWQTQMIGFVRAAEATHPQLTAGHLIAVQPFTAAGAAYWTANPGVNVINGHYTQVATTPTTPYPSGPPRSAFLDLGAIRLIRDNWSAKKIFALNEDNITPFGGAKGTRGLRTDMSPRIRLFGIPDPVRAEAWEFLLDGGGAFDHFGYSFNSTIGADIRTQLGLIAKYLSAQQVWKLKPNKAPGWVTIGQYPTASSWEDTDSRKYWAAMESAGWQTATNGRKFLLYIHHSTPRCKVNEDDFAKPASNLPPRCTGQNLAFDAYDARLRSNQRYGETSLKLSLGNQAGTFNVYWLNPKAPIETTPPSEVIHWIPASGGSCDGRTPCTVTSPSYPYDIALEVRQ